MTVRRPSWHLIQTTVTRNIDVTPVNDAPTAANTTVATDENISYVFALADFNFSDLEGDSLAQVQITGL